MKNKYTISILIAFLSFITTQIFAAAPEVNYLDSKYFGLEAGGNGWWIQHKDNWSVTTDKAASGNYSLKYTNSVAASGQLKASVGSADFTGSKLSIDAGTYTMKMKVWIDNDADITGFYTKIKTPWINIAWSFDGVAKGEWVELTKEVTFTQDIPGSIVLFVVEPGNGGKGTMYIDDVSIIGEGVEEIPAMSQLETIGEGNMNLAAGNYDMKLKVWVASDATISFFSTDISESQNSLKWQLDNIAKEQWVELTQQVTLDRDAINSPLRMVVPNIPEFGGGTGSFYVDDISFQSESTPVTPIHKELVCNVYPNPADDILTIESPVGSNIAICNISGTVVERFDNELGVTRISVSELPTGIYFVKIASAGKTTVKKIQIR